MRLLLLFAFALPCFAQEASHLSHRLHNCEVEIEMLKNGISTQQQARESLEKEVSKMLKATRSALTSAQKSGEGQKKSLTSTAEKLQSDLQILKKHANELTETVNSLSKSVQEIKKDEHKNARAIKELEQAMRTLTTVLNPDTREETYTVKSGDSLGKIAHAHKMSVQELKELNGLVDTTIRPGQHLTIRHK